MGVSWIMKKITVYNLRKLKYGDHKLIGNYGIWAEANKIKPFHLKL